MRTVPALTLVLLLSLFGAGCASKQIVVKPFGPKPLAPKAWQSVEEAQLASTARETREPAAAKLVALENWEAQFPNSDFAELRLEQKIIAYQRLQKWREVFDSSRKLLEIDPFRLYGLIGIASSIQLIAPTDDQLEFAATACRRMVDSPDIVFTHIAVSNRIPKQPVTIAVLTNLGWIDMQRKDYPNAILDLYYVLALDPTQAGVSYMLGAAMIAQREDPSAQRTAIYHLTRAATYDGPNALPPEQRKAALDYVTRIWLQYFGTAESFERLAALARSSPFPSGDFR